MSSRNLSILALCLLSVFGCGGSGGNSSSTPANRAPVFASPTTASALENVNGTVYTVSVSDADGDAISLSLAGPDAAAFAISNSTRAISFVSPPNFESPNDADQNNDYDITISASDGGATVSLNVTISVSDVNEPPEFQGASNLTVEEGDKIYVIVNPENPTASDLTLTDPDGDRLFIDSTNGFLTGADTAYFNVGESTRANAPLERIFLGSIQPFDFEAPADADQDNQYDITLNVTDGVNISSLDLTVSVQDVSGETLLQEQGVAAVVGFETIDDVGSSVALMGDLTGDGRSEALIGAERTLSAELVGGVNGRPGAVYLIASERIAQTVDAKVDLSEDGDGSIVRIVWPSTIQSRFPEFGHRALSLGDINGDGFAEVAVSSDGGGSSPPQSEVYILSGAALRGALGAANANPEIMVSSLSPTRILETALNDGLGWDMSLLEDIDGDDVDELVICASDARTSTFGEPARSGSVFVVFGSTIPAALSSGSDLNVDSFVLGSEAIRLDGADQFASDCTAVSSAGDFDADGVMDLLIGEGRSGQASQSRAHLVFGTTLLSEKSEDGILRLENLEIPGDGFSIISERTLDGLGDSVSGIGDFNDDGFDDIAIGAPATGNDVASEASSRGAVNVIFGTSSSFSSSIARDEIATRALGFTILGLNGSDRLGEQVAPAGDINGDGFADFYLLVPGVNPTRNGREFSDNGQVSLILGSDISPGGEIEISEIDSGTRVFGSSSTQGMISLDQAADIDGDGVSDLLIGATSGSRCINGELVGSIGHGLIVLSSRLRTAISNGDDIDLNNHLYGGILATDIPGSQSRVECVAPDQ